MKPFRFRAQVALDLREREDEDARRALATAEARERAAHDALRAAIAALDEVMRRGRDEERLPGELTVRLWYRNWIVGQQQQVARCRHVLDARQAEVRAATLRAQAARRKLKSLERFRDRLRRRYTDAERREEQKVLDDLGTVRFVLERPQPGGLT